VHTSDLVIVGRFSASTTVELFERGGEVDDKWDVLRSQTSAVRSMSISLCLISREESDSWEPVEMISDCYKIVSKKRSSVGYLM
jgi:hypothetical protein